MMPRSDDSDEHAPSAKDAKGLIASLQKRWRIFWDDRSLDKEIEQAVKLVNESNPERNSASICFGNLPTLIRRSLMPTPLDLMMLSKAFMLKYQNRVTACERLILRAKLQGRPDLVLRLTERLDKYDAERAQLFEEFIERRSYAYTACNEFMSRVLMQARSTGLLAIASRIEGEIIQKEKVIARMGNTEDHSRRELLGEEFECLEKVVAVNEAKAKESGDVLSKLARANIDEMPGDQLVVACGVAKDALVELKNKSLEVVSIETTIKEEIENTCANISYWTDLLAEAQDNNDVLEVVLMKRRIIAYQEQKAQFEQSLKLLVSERQRIDSKCNLGTYFEGNYESI